MTEIVIQGIGGRMGHVLCDLIAQRRHRPEGRRDQRHPGVRQSGKAGR